LCYFWTLRIIECVLLTTIIKTQFVQTTCANKSLSSSRRVPQRARGLHVARCGGGSCASHRSATLRRAAARGRAPSRAHARIGAPVGNNPFDGEDDGRAPSLDVQRYHRAGRPNYKSPQHFRRKRCHRGAINPFDDVSHANRRLCVGAGMDLFDNERVALAEEGDAKSAMRRGGRERGGVAVVAEKGRV
jgi:hypothetical protein